MAKFKASSLWETKELRYNFAHTRDFGWGSGMTQADIEAKFCKACANWTAHCGITFTKSDGRADFVITWGKYEKKDGRLIGADTTPKGTGGS
jgi:hypothetical protein